MGYPYTTAQRAKITAEAPRPLSEAEYEEIEILASHCPLATPAKKTNSINGHCRTLLKRLRGLSPEPGRYSLWSPEISRLMNALPFELVAQPEMSHALEQYLFNFARFYRRCGGHVGKAANSPAARFIAACAIPPAEAAGWRLEETTIRNMIIRRRWWAVDLVVGPPEIGSPTLGIKEPKPE
jgi:hypothetical protein